MRHLSLFLLCLPTLFTAVCAASPTTLPTTLPAIPNVSSLEDLRALPPIEIAGCHAQVGIADGGRDAGPWKALYCLVTGQASFEGDGDSLGPLAVQIEGNIEGVRRPFANEISKQKDVGFRQAKGGLLFARIIPLHRKGKWDLTVSVPTAEPNAEPKRLLRSRFEVKEDAPLYWQQFATLERFEHDRGETHFRYITVDQPFAAVPRTDDVPFRLPAQDETPPPTGNPLKENHLPNGIPLQGGWADLITGTKTPQTIDAPPLRLSIEDGWFVVQSRGPQMYDLADRRLLARWWVNSRPISASPATRQVLLNEGRQITRTKELRIRRGLPGALGALRIGDRIALQVLYTPQDLKPVLSVKEAAQVQQKIQQSMDDPECLLPSNRVEFVVTEAMLRDRR